MTVSHTRSAPVPPAPAPAPASVPPVATQPAPILTGFTPVPRQRNRDDGWTPERQRDFIAAIACNGSVQAACRALNMSARGAYELRQHPEAGEFRAAWDMAATEGLTIMEDVAWDRAINGTDQAIMYKGERVGVRIHYDSRLLMFMLRKRRPEVYGPDARIRRPQPGDRIYEEMRAEWKAEYDGEAVVRNEQSMKDTEDRIQKLRDRMMQTRPDFRVRMMTQTPELAEKYRTHFPEEYALAMELVELENGYDDDGNPIVPDAQIEEDRLEGDESGTADTREEEDADADADGCEVTRDPEQEAAAERIRRMTSVFPGRQCTPGGAALAPRS